MPSSKPEVVSCGIDYLLFNIKVHSEQDRDTLIANIQTIANNLSAQKELSINQVLYPKSGYGLSIRLPLFTEITHTGSNYETPHLFIQLDSKFLTRPFFRCEIKGHPLTKDQWFCVRLWLEQLFSKNLYSTYILKARVNRVDIAADFNADIEQFMFDHARSQSGGVFFNRKGEIRTIYIGSKDSTYKVCIYCRRTKREQICKPTFNGFLTRLEVRLKLSTASLFDLHCNTGLGVGDPFAKFTIYDFKKMTDSDLINDDFLDLCRAWGIKTVLQRRNQNERRNIRKELEKFEVLMIDEALLMNLYFKDLKKLEVLSPSFNVKQTKAIQVIQKFNRLYLSK